MAQADDIEGRVVLGETLYEIKRFFGREALADTSSGPISQVAAAQDGRVFIFKRGSPPVLVLAADGSKQAAWGDELLLDPHGITIGRSGHLLLVDRDAHQILICTPEGELLRTIGDRHRPRNQAPFNHPTAAAEAPDGTVWIADGYGNSCVHGFSSTGEHLLTFGAPGTGKGQFSTPHAIVIDSRDRILVADRENNRIQVFDRDGQWLDQWGDLYHPMDMHEDIDGTILVSDQIPRLNRFDLDGQLIGRCRPAWNVPHGLSGDADGRLYLAEMNPSSIVRLTPLTHTT